VRANTKVADDTTKVYQNFFYDRMEKTTSSCDVKSLSSTWLDNQESNGWIVHCPKYQGKFHKKHCKAIKNIEAIEDLGQLKDIYVDLEGCDGKTCYIANNVKKFLRT
jgi:hypothetical protein